ncbi:MAG: hypothetical protein JSS53_10445, partial [Proteobacteria bacterium]|nr:hypothetical protein [Pseudomonadota bacterium]
MIKLKKSIEERNIEKIVSVLNAMSKKGEDLKGICLIHLKDDLAGKIDIEAFSKLGVIFNLGEFYSFYNEKIEKYPDDLSARYYLKRLLRGAAQLISAWKNLTLKNAEASKILDNQMSEALVANKENLIFFKKSLDELLVESIQEFTKTWLSSNPKPDDEQGLAINKVIQNVFQGFFFSENSQYKEITEKLIENRSRIVFSDYKAMALSQDLNGSLTDVLTQFVIEELLTQPKVFGVTSLGRYIVSKSPAIIVHSPDDYHETFKEKVLSAWRSDSFPLEAKKQLDDIIVKKIKTIELPENYRTFAEYRAVLDLLS